MPSANVKIFWLLLHRLAKVTRSQSAALRNAFEFDLDFDIKKAQNIRFGMSAYRTTESLE